MPELDFIANALRYLTLKPKCQTHGATGKFRGLSKLLGFIPGDRVRLYQPL